MDERPRPGARQTYTIVPEGTRHAGLPVCSLGCTADYARQHAQPFRLARSPSTWKFCSHCVMCGDAIRIPDTCNLHHEPCPDVRWEATLVAATIVAVMYERGHRRPVTDQQLALARTIQTSSPHLDPDIIALRVLVKTQLPRRTRDA